MDPLVITSEPSVEQPSIVLPEFVAPEIVVPDVVVPADSAPDATADGAVEEKVRETMNESLEERVDEKASEVGEREKRDDKKADEKAGEDAVTPLPTTETTAQNGVPAQQNAEKKRYTIDELRAASARKKEKREKRLEEIVAMVRERGSISRDDIVSAYKVSPQAARAYTKTLLKRGVLKKKVEVRYRVA